MADYVEQIGEDADTVLLRITADGYERLQSLATDPLEGDAGDDYPAVLTPVDRLMLDLLLQEVAVHRIRAHIIGEWLDEGLDDGRVRIRSRYLRKLGRRLGRVEAERNAAMVERERNRPE